jgi:hypothetical protein
MKKNSCLIVLNYRLLSDKNERLYIFTHNGDYPHSSTYSEIHHKRIPPPVWELIGAMVNRELTEQAVIYLAVIQGGTSC